MKENQIIICTDHPEWGTWRVLRHYHESIWEIRGDAGDRTLNEDEFNRFWHVAGGSI